jgi:predicted ATPase
MEGIESDLAVVVPGARRIRALPARVHRTEQLRIAVDGTETVSERRREVTGARFEVEFDGQGWIRSGQLSEGTALALGLITAMRSNQADVLLLDDVDKGLHPVAQREIIAFLRRILEANPAVQVVATSHSPFVLDALEPDEVLVAGPVGPAESRIRRLVDHPAWLSRSKYMRPGEFWSFVGEGWVAEG